MSSLIDYDDEQGWYCTCPCHNAPDVGGDAGWPADCVCPGYDFDALVCGEQQHRDDIDDERAGLL